MARISERECFQKRNNNFAGKLSSDKSHTPKFDIKYANDQNIFGFQIYQKPSAFLSKVAAQALLKALHHFAKI